MTNTIAPSTKYYEFKDKQLAYSLLYQVRNTIRAAPNVYSSASVKLDSAKIVLVSGVSDSVLEKILEQIPRPPVRSWTA